MTRDEEQVMKCYVVEYIPKSREAGYFSSMLVENLTRYDYKRLSAYTFLVVTEESAENLRRDLSVDLFPDDGLFILRSGTEAAWRNVDVDSKLLKEHL